VKIEIDAQLLGRILGNLDIAAWEYADAGQAISGSPPCGTTDTARRRLVKGREYLTSAREELAALTKPQPSCPMCGPDGSPGEIALVGSGKLIPCPMCRLKDHEAAVFSMTRTEVRLEEGFA
jgi:hypothetical protein